jgi:hypothetical protein
MIRTAKPLASPMPHVGNVRVARAFSLIFFSSSEDLQKKVSMPGPGTWSPTKLQPIQARWSPTKIQPVQPDSVTWTRPHVFLISMLAGLRTLMGGCLWSSASMATPTPLFQTNMLIYRGKSSSLHWDVPTGKALHCAEAAMCKIKT